MQEEIQMGRFEVRVGGFYVNDSKGLVREITHEDEDGEYVYWRSYALSDGRPTGDGLKCSPYTILQWANREATPAEVARMQRGDADSRQMMEALSLADKVLKSVTDDMLFAEVRRRGRQVT
jgi:hypothetical protein